MGFSVADLNDETQLRRKAALTPCGSKEGLRRWFRMYIGLDFPDVVIDPDSTGSPMDTFWEVYRAGVNRDFDFARRVMMYASRDSYKTLGASALELLAMLHMTRSVVHLAAIEQQAGKAQEYLRRFLESEDLNEFKVGDNKRTIAVCWFEHKATGNILTLDEWKQLGGRKNIGQYVRHSYYTKVIVNTPQSANSDHVAFMVVDEVDLIRFPKAYEEAKLIPGVQRDVHGREQPPITVLTSTRKSSGGLVQKELDDAKKTGLQVRHWNILDVSARCPDQRHRPDLPKERVFRSDETLQTISPSEFEALKVQDPKKAESYVEDEAYAGCVENCPIFAACRGRLALQKSTASLLKNVEDTIGKFKDTAGNPDMAKSQLLCWKPGNEGAIYGKFNRKLHMKTAAEIWGMVQGEPPLGPVSKDDLIAMLVSVGARCSSGLDWGYTHCFAVTTMWIWGRIAFILDAFEIPGLDPNESVEACDQRIKKWNPVCWPDTAYPAYIKMFRKAGYQMREHTKDVLGGINVVRRKLYPGDKKPPELYLLADDDGCEHLAKRIEGYKWKLDAAGRATDVPDDTDDDLCDSSRYGIQNNFDKQGKVIVGQGVVANTGPLPMPMPAAQTWMSQKIAELTGGEVAPTGTAAPVDKRGRKGTFCWDMA